VGEEDFSKIVEKRREEGVREMDDDRLREGERKSGEGPRESEGKTLLPI